MENYTIEMKWNKILNQWILRNDELGVYERVDEGDKFTAIHELKKLAAQNEIELHFMNVE